MSIQMQNYLNNIVFCAVGHQQMMTVRNFIELYSAETLLFRRIVKLRFVVKVPANKAIMSQTWNSDVAFILQQSGIFIILTLCYSQHVFLCSN